MTTEKTDNTPGVRHAKQVGGYILILIAFSSLFAFLFSQFRTAALQSLTVANDSFSNYVDSVLVLSNANIRTSAMQVFYTSSVRTLRISDDLSWSERTIGHRDLGNFVSSSSFIDNIIVYNDNLDMVFTSESGYGSAPSGEFHDQGAVYLLLHPEEHSYLTPFKREVNGSTHYSFIFSTRDSSGFSSMLLDINAGWYEAQLLGNLSRDRHMIVDGQGQLILGEDNPERPDWSLFETAFLTSPESGNVRSSNSFFLSSCWVYHKLGQTDWYYLEEFLLEADAPGLVRVEKVAFSIFALVGVVILVLVAYLLFAVLPSFNHIARTLTSLRKEGTGVTGTFDTLVSNHQAYESSRKFQEMQAGSLPEDTALPVVLVLTERGLGDRLCSLVRSCGAEEITSANSELGDALVLPACTDALRDQLVDVLRESGIAPPIFVSLPCYSEQQILAAFDALDELRRLAFLYPEQEILCQELLDSCNQSSGFQPKLVSSMEAALKKGQFEVAQAQWVLLLDRIRRDRFHDLYFALHYVDRMLITLATEYGLAPAEPIDDCLTSLDTLQAHINGRLLAVTDAVAVQHQQLAESLTVAVWDKIRTLYHDENCCSQMIAERMGMSPTYLNRQFRAAANISINDAIQQVRIDVVSDLLSRSDLPVEQIARQAGYSNTKYFFVLFKKYTGKTPAQFRSEQTQKA